MANISTHRSVEIEYAAAMERYYLISPRTATRFAHAYEAALGMIRHQPELFGLCDDIHRWCPLKKFPYGIIYRIDGSDVRIVGLAHNRQLPADWSRRK